MRGATVLRVATPEPFHFGDVLRCVQKEVEAQSFLSTKVQTMRDVISLGVQRVPE